MTPHSLSRRRFLGQAGCAALTSLPLLSTLLNLRMANAAVAGSGGDYRALVCLFLFGGNDSFNMLVPYGSDEYNEYKNVRGDLALPRTGTGAILPISNLSDQGGRTFAVHPGMPEVRDLFEAGHLAFLTNVGTLRESQTSVAKFNGGINLPLGLFSHSDQQEQWQTSRPDTRTSLGWGGQAADLLQSLNPASNVSMNISIAGSNIFQTGDSAFGYSVAATGAEALEGYGATSGVDLFRTNGVNSLLEQEYVNLLERGYSQNVRRALDAQAEFTAGLANTNLTTAFPTDNALADQLKLVARIIKGRSPAIRHQTFFVSMGGWDHHDEVKGNQAAMLPKVSQAMRAFWDALVEIGATNNVTLFQASDFGRTLSSNGQGSDHAWGGNYMVMGGAVRGQRIYGDYPVLAPGSDRDAGRGRLIPGISVDEMARDLVRWFGVSNSQMPQVLPNIGSFTGGASGSLGFLV